MADRGATTSTHIVVPTGQNMVALLGHSDELLRLIEGSVRCDIHVRGNEITLSGDRDEVAVASRLFAELLLLLERGEALTPDAVQRSLRMLREQSDERPADVLSLNIVSSRGRTIRPKTLNQKRYVDAIDNHTIVFGIGPAGTGKTYLAMAKAVQALQSKQVNRIILTRPAVEAGERLGFLPGTLNEKIDPYLRPLYDALHDMVDPDSIPRLMASGVIEVAPLAYMRGRAQPVDTPVLTPDGFRPIGSLRVGDLVVGSNGLPTPVLGVYPQGRKAVFRVTAEDGASTLACGEHLWSVQVLDDVDPGRGASEKVLQTNEMIGRLTAGGQPRFALPLVDPVEFVPREVTVDPYSAGALIGAGRLPARADRGRGGLSTAEPVTTTGIPEDYLLTSVAARLGLLQGLLDSAGAVVDAGIDAGVQFTAVSDRLRDDVVFLVRSLGGLARTHVTSPRVVTITLPVGMSPFTIEPQRSAYAAVGERRPVRVVDAIEPVGDAECVCISVAAADSLYVTTDFLVTHNTLNDSFIVLDEAQNTSAEQMKMFLTRLGFGSKMAVTGDVTQVDLPSGTKSGLRIVQDILDGIEDVAFCRLTSQDVVRHKLVSDIVDAYAKHDAAEEASADSSRSQQGPRRQTRASR